VGTGELQTALRREGERKAAAIRQAAETEAARLQDEYAAKYALLEEECRQKQEKATAAEERPFRLASGRRDGPLAAA
jgi:hypothetical protein